MSIARDVSDSRKILSLAILACLVGIIFLKTRLNLSAYLFMGAGAFLPLPLIIVLARRSADRSRRGCLPLALSVGISSAEKGDLPSLVTSIHYRVGRGSVIGEREKACFDCILSDILYEDKNLYNLLIEEVGSEQSKNFLS